MQPRASLVVPMQSSRHARRHGASGDPATHVGTTGGMKHCRACCIFLTPQPAVAKHGRRRLVVARLVAGARSVAHPSLGVADRGFSHRVRGGWCPPVVVRPDHRASKRECVFPHREDRLAPIFFDTPRAAVLAVSPVSLLLPPWVRARRDPTPGGGAHSFPYATCAVT